jgi:catechol 2,3-dioxygenase-like lactoylglutathione lyase family enzyme
MTDIDLAPPLTPELKCADYDQSVKFYTDILGFNIAYDRPEEGFAMFEHEGAYLMIDSHIHCARFIKFEMEKPFGRGINLQIKVLDVDALHDNVVSNGWPIYLDMEEKWYRCGDVEAGNRQFLVQDPDGYVLRFFKDLGERNNI